MSGEKLWILYDERAILGGPDGAAVLSSCTSLAEALTEADEDWGWACAIYQYDVVGRGKLMGEQLVAHRNMRP